MLDIRLPWFSQNTSDRKLSLQKTKHTQLKNVLTIHQKIINHRLSWDCQNTLSNDCLNKPKTCLTKDCLDTQEKRYSPSPKDHLDIRKYTRLKIDLTKELIKESLGNLKHCLNNSPKHLTENCLESTKHIQPESQHSQMQSTKDRSNIHWRLKMVMTLTELSQPKIVRHSWNTL